MSGSSETELTGKRVLVTGGTRGIGEAIVQRLRGSGATVVTTARSTPVTCFSRICLATGGQRINEVLGATWAEFDRERMLWELPSWRTKNGKPHVVPLIPLIAQLLDDLRAHTGASQYLFPKRRNAAEPMELGTISKVIAQFCETIDTNGHKIEGQAGAKPFTKFTPRDLRRTCKTRMGEI